MPPDEGLALHAAAVAALTAVGSAPMLEIGSYCGKSALYLGSAARDAGRVLFALDHHRGSEENQAGWEHHDADLVDPDLDLLDTLATFRSTIHEVGLERVVVALVGHSEVVAPVWGSMLALLFIDGGHGSEPPTATTSCGLPTLPRVAHWRSTTCFPTQTTAGARPMRSICGPSSPASSSRPATPARSACYGAPDPGASEAGSSEGGVAPTSEVPAIGAAALQRALERRL